MEFIQDKCPICAATDIRRIDSILGRDGREYQAVRCRVCTLIFVSPFPVLTQEDCEEIYNREYYESNWGDAGHGYFDAEKAAQMREESERQRRAIECVTGIKQRSILDVGCGDGRYLEAFAKAGWQAFGIEVSREAVSHAQPVEGVTIFHGAIESADLGADRFDVIRLKHCIEHLSRPRETLESVFRLLKPGGFLVLDTDNAESLRSRTERFIRRMAGPAAQAAVRILMKKDLRTRFGRLSPPVHLLYFSPRSLAYALEAVGFSVKWIFSVHHGHPVWFPLVHPFRCHPVEAIFRLVDRIGTTVDCGEALVCFAEKKSSHPSPVSKDGEGERGEP